MTIKIMRCKVTRKAGTLLFMFIGLLSLGIKSYAQSNEVIDQFLETEIASYDLSVYLVLAGAKLIPEDLPPQVALESLKQRNWGYSPEKSTNPLTVGDFSFMIMKSFNISGGIMFSLFPSPWYATREFNFRRFLVNPKKAGETMTSFEVVQALNNVIEWQENQAK